MKAGAFNILARPINTELLIRTVRAALADHFSSQSKYHELSALGRRWATLTSREQQVFQLVATGWSNKQVAAALRITDRTVNGHRRGAMAKMKARRITDAVRMLQDLSRHEQDCGGLSHSLFPQASGVGEGGTLESPYRHV
jgi:FixJ family two-component response regulator